jgi:XTP/dITP diphosphohydrolase
LKGRERIVYFATENRGKYVEAARLATEFGLRLKQLHRHKMEIQSDNLREIASFAAKEACEATLHPVVAEDSGFFVQALSGFPGPYSAYVFRIIGYKGILRLLGSARNRGASFQATVAFCMPKADPVCFSGTVKGAVTRHPKGIHGFGFDPIFTPDEGDGRTFAEMSTDDKNLLSHRARAFTKFFKWLTI